MGTASPPAPAGGPSAATGAPAAGDGLPGEQAPGDAGSGPGPGSVPRGGLLAPVAALGRAVLATVATIGDAGLFAAAGIRAVFTPPWFPRQIARQLLAVGFLSLPVVGLTAWFTGAALALNIYSGGDRFNAETVMPQIVGLGLTRELGPVLAALMLAGRVAAAMASEIGAMRATEQIDAMETLSTDPMRWLIAPRLLAATLCLPLLTVIVDIIGISGGLLVAMHLLDANPVVYLRNTMDFLTRWDVESGLLKALAFGFIVGLMGCWHGARAKGGARGVGQAVTQAVVSSAILILAADYLLTSVFARL